MLIELMIQQEIERKLHNTYNTYIAYASKTRIPSAKCFFHFCPPPRAPGPRSDYCPGASKLPHLTHRSDPLKPTMRSSYGNNQTRKFNVETNGRIQTKKISQLKQTKCNSAHESMETIFPLCCTSTARGNPRTYATSCQVHIFVDKRKAKIVPFTKPWQRFWKICSVF